MDPADPPGLDADLEFLLAAIRRRVAGLGPGARLTLVARWPDGRVLAAGDDDRREAGRALASQGE